jgi:hypothetical protein
LCSCGRTRAGGAAAEGECCWEKGEERAEGGRTVFEVAEVEEGEDGLGACEAFGESNEGGRVEVSAAAVVED